MVTNASSSGRLSISRPPAGRRWYRRARSRSPATRRPRGRAA